MPFFTVFTATFNRGYILPKLYDSLKKQEIMDFEWLVIDDGSSDETEQLFQQWIHDETMFPIRYMKKDNGGKPRAINYGIQYAKGEYFFMVDSDDTLKPHALSKMKQWCKEIENKPQFIGVGAARGFPDGSYIKGIAPSVNEYGYIDASNLQRKDFNLDADMCEAYKTEILKKYPMPEWPGEKFAPEQIALNEISSSKYSSASGYLNETFLNSTVPTSFALAPLPSFTLITVSNTSLILFADTLALGSIINIIANIKNDIITCIA